MLGRPIEIGDLVVATTGRPSQGHLCIRRVKRLTPKMVGTVNLIESNPIGQLEYGKHLIKIEEDIIAQAVLTGNLTEKGLINQNNSV